MGPPPRESNFYSKVQDFEREIDSVLTRLILGSGGPGGPVDSPGASLCELDKWGSVSEASLCEWVLFIISKGLVYFSRGEIFQETGKN